MAKAGSCKIGLKPKPFSWTGIILSNGFDVITVNNKENKKIGIGVVAYNSSDAKKIVGKKSKDILIILGNETRDELIHKDDLVKI